MLTSSSSLATVSQTITVTEEVPLIETTNAELGGTLQNAIIENLPERAETLRILLTLRLAGEILCGWRRLDAKHQRIRPHDNVYMVEVSEQRLSPGWLRAL